MDYELAKELKDAGFPQKLKDGDWFQDGRMKEPMLRYCDSDYGYDEYPHATKIPTLSELIEACGDGFSHLLRYYLSTNLVWSTIPVGDNINLLPPGQTTLSCKTPEEAVARLWLALNK